jgi:hypothetical protein
MPQLFHNIKGGPLRRILTLLLVAFLEVLKKHLFLSAGFWRCKQLTTDSLVFGSGIHNE